MTQSPLSLLFLFLPTFSVPLLFYFRDELDPAKELFAELLRLSFLPIPTWLFTKEIPLLSYIIIDVFF
jgi:hypothetical protein